MPFTPDKVSGEAASGMLNDPIAWQPAPRKVIFQVMGQHARTRSSTQNVVSATAPDATFHEVSDYCYPTSNIAISQLQQGLAT